jgi:hypothetical protein
MYIVSMEATHMTFKPGSHDPIRAAREQRNFLAGSDGMGNEREQQVLAAQKSRKPSVITCGHQLTESEEAYYQRYPELDKLCSKCVESERAQ